MRFPRFHLSTLLLFCVFCGACIGVWLAPQVWEREWMLPVDETGVYRITNSNEPLSDPALIEFDKTGTRLIFLQSRRIGIVDLKNRTAVWQGSPGAGFFTESIRFIENDAVLQIRDVSIVVKDPANSVGSMYYWNVSDGTIAPQPQRVEPWPDGWYAETSVKNQHAPNDFEHWLPFFPERQFLILDSKTITILARLSVPGKPCVAGYSKDGQYLATGHQGGITFWRRTRGYGWRGYLELPLLWVAVVSFGGLVTIFVRWLLRRRTQHLNRGLA